MAWRTRRRPFSPAASSAAVRSARVACGEKSCGTRTLRKSRLIFPPSDTRDCKARAIAGVVLPHDAGRTTAGAYVAFEVRTAAVFAHILVPLDLGPRNERALVTARTLAVNNRARVTLLHVVEQIEHVPVAELRRFYARLEKEAQRRLAQAARRFAEKKVPIEAAVTTGNPAHEIVRWAAANDVDLIILGSHKVDPARLGQGLGATSTLVGSRSRCQ